MAIVYTRRTSPGDPAQATFNVALEGPAGPQGPVGPVGPVGPEGPTGPAGPQGPVDTSSVAKAGDTMTGNLNLPTLQINHTGSAFSDIYFKRNDLPRWLIRGAGFDETGSGNAGSNFDLYRLSDAGAILGGGTLLSINRATGTMVLAGPFIEKPLTSATPPSNGDMMFELTSNTQLKVKVKGSDGVVRSATLTLA